MELQVYCWNIQTNSEKSIQKGKATIAQAMRRPPGSLDDHGFDPTSPWVLAILENKGGGAEVGQMLCTELGGEWSQVVELGGSSFTRENIVLIGGGGCHLVDDPAAFTGWQTSFRTWQTDAHTASMEKAANAMASRRIPLRQATERYGDRVVIAERQTPKLAEDCRNPAIVTVRVPGVQDFKLGFLHAPGPGEKSHPGVNEPDRKWTETLAGLYAETVMATLNDENLDALLGDFNLYGTGPEMPHMTWFSKDLGPTTCKKDSGEDVKDGGKFDRVYAKPGMCLGKPRKVANFGPGLTDHIGVGVVLVRPAVANKRERADSDDDGAIDPKRAKKVSSSDVDPMQVDALGSATSSGDASSMSDD